MVGVINALNLIDGLDGLAGGVAFFGVGTNFILALMRGDVLLCLLMVALAGAILGFLVFNFNPASIFMGDTGQHVPGLRARGGVHQDVDQERHRRGLLVPVMALGLPIMDTLLAMVRRSLLGRPLFSADKEHIHHRLMSRLAAHPPHRRAGALRAVRALHAHRAGAPLRQQRAERAAARAAWRVVIVVLMRKLGYLDLRHAGAVSRRAGAEHQPALAGEGRHRRRARSRLAPGRCGTPCARWPRRWTWPRLELRLRRPHEGLTTGIVFETQRPRGRHLRAAGGARGGEGRRRAARLAAPRAGATGAAQSTVTRSWRWSWSRTRWPSAPAALMALDADASPSASSHCGGERVAAAPGPC